MPIIKYKDATNLTEIYQQTGLYFAFISAPKNKNLQCHPLVKCRDFLQDAVRCTIPNSGVSGCKIYGFKYEHKVDPPVDLSKIRLIVTYKNLKLNITDCSIKMMYALKLIHHYEDLMGIKVKTVQKQLNHKDFPNPIWTFTGNSIWVRSPVLVSLYTFLIRLGDKKLEFKDNKELHSKYEQLIKNNIDKDNKIKDNDIQYLQSIYPKLDMFIKNYKKILFTDNKFDTLFLNKSISIYSFHDHSGILSLAKKTICDVSVKEKYMEFTS